MLLKHVLRWSCRRRGELTGAVLAALADGSWSQLDLAGCRRLYAAEVLAVAHAMPGIRVLDVTGGRCCRLGTMRSRLVGFDDDIRMLVRRQMQLGAPLF
jgi:hypothetical protein